MELQTPLHSVVAQIRELLSVANITYSYFEHEPVRTSEEANALRPNFTLSQGAKALIVRSKKAADEYEFVMAVLPGDRKLDSKKFKLILDSKGINFASQEESDKITGGIEFGGVPPFGNLFNIPVYVDQKLFDNAEIIFNCGDRRATIAMKAIDWQSLVEPVVGDITA